MASSIAVAEERASTVVSACGRYVHGRRGRSDLGRARDSTGRLVRSDRRSRGLGRGPKAAGPHGVTVTHWTYIETLNAWGCCWRSGETTRCHRRSAYPRARARNRGRSRPDSLHPSPACPAGSAAHDPTSRCRGQSWRCSPRTGSRIHRSRPEARSVRGPYRPHRSHRPHRTGSTRRTLETLLIPGERHMIGLGARVRRSGCLDAVDRPGLGDEAGQQ